MSHAQQITVSVVTGELQTRSNCSRAIPNPAEAMKESTAWAIDIDDVGFAWPGNRRSSNPRSKGPWRTDISEGLERQR